MCRERSPRLAADVAGCSRLMGANGEDTHERLRAHLRELVDPRITKHRGRIVKNTGDGMLAEFPNVVIGLTALAIGTCAGISMFG
jgi:class 3 adenylate cyclase